MSNLQKYHVSKNLFDEDYSGISSTAKYVAVEVGNGNFTVSSTVPRSGTAAVLFLLAGNVSAGISSDINGVWDGQNRTVTAIDGFITIAFRAYADANPVNSNTMLNSGSTALLYEPYSPDVWRDLAPQQYINGVFVDNANIPEKYSGGSWG